jgi:hypothetical protein
VKRIELAAGLAFALFLANVLLFVYEPFGESFYVIADSLVAILALLAALAGFYAYRLHGFRSTQGKALLFMAAGSFFWFLGELTWGLYEIALGVEKPVSSVADIFWFIGYPLFMIGLYYIFRLSLLPGRRKLVVVTAAMALVFSLMLYLAVPTMTDATMSLEEKISTAGYMVGDAFLLAGLAFAIACLFGSRFAKPWSVLLLAIVLSAVADVCYTNFFSVYQTGNLIDLLWNTDYILFAFGFIYYRETVKDIMSAAEQKKKK